LLIAYKLQSRPRSNASVRTLLKWHRRMPTETTKIMSFHYQQGYVDGKTPAPTKILQFLTGGSS